MLEKHLDEAKHAALDTLRKFIYNNSKIQRIMLIDDIFGGLRVVIWADGVADRELLSNIDSELKIAASIFWTGDIWLALEGPDIDRAVYERAWEEAQILVDIPNIRISHRYRSRGMWLQGLSEPLWKVPEEGPSIIVFYSFKGGVGRSTALASFAIQRARMGERVTVIDFDLDAPGVGLLLAADERGTIAPWGTIDYLLECPYGNIDLRDYYHACRRENITKEGEILVIPAAGQMNQDYLDKLSRIDFETAPNREQSHPLLTLIDQIRRDLKPDWLLLDGRAGLSDAAGLLLSGLAHLYVLFGTSSEQSWQGLRLVLKRLGADQIQSNNMQRDCLIVQAMIPKDRDVSLRAKRKFSDRARDEFTDWYYSVDPEDPTEDKLWYVRDMEDEEALWVPIPISYYLEFANFEKIDDIADDLAGLPEYRTLARRIAARFEVEETEL